MEPLGDRPALGDYTPSGDSDYADGRRKWQRAFESWAKATRTQEWEWGATLRSIASSYEEWQTLRAEPLPEVAKWARAEGRDPD